MCIKFTFLLLKWKKSPVSVFFVLDGFILINVVALSLYPPSPSPFYPLIPPPSYPQNLVTDWFYTCMERQIWIHTKYSLHISFSEGRYWPLVTFQDHLDVWEWLSATAGIHNLWLVHLKLQIFKRVNLIEKNIQLKAHYHYCCYHHWPHVLLLTRQNNI